MDISSIIPVILITSLVQFCKEVGMPSKLAPIVVFLLAVLFGIIFIWNVDLMKNLVAILQFALGAIGLWEISKPTYQQIVSKVKGDEV